MRILKIDGSRACTIIMALQIRIRVTSIVAVEKL